MDNYSIHSGKCSSSGARLRPSLAAESLVGPAPSPSRSRSTWRSLERNPWGVRQGIEGSDQSIASSSRSRHGAHSVAERPTSPAFMKLLSQRSPRTPPSEGSRSPSVMSQLSGRRRVSSPAIAARAWLDTSSPSPSQSPVARAELGSSGRGTESPQTFTVLSLPHSKTDRTKSRDESEDCRGRSGSSRRHGHRRSHSRSRRETQDKRKKEGTVLCPKKRNPEELHCKSASRPPPKKLMSPRRLPPPTFEKILLGLVDGDFTSGNDEVDVFGGKATEQHEPAPLAQQTDEECFSVSVEQTDSIQGDEVRISSSFSPPSSGRSSVGNRYEHHSQQDGVIPEHFLYIPPLRLCGNAAEERRPVPSMMQPTGDEEQASVREDRRHIATLFSLEAAESQAQKARLQEQLRETTPFRLREVGGSSPSQSEGVEIIGPPPGKSKRRERSTLLETIVREHDWESGEQIFEENIRISPEQPQQEETSQGPEILQWHYFASDEEPEGENARSKISEAGTHSPCTSEQRSPMTLDNAAISARADNVPELLPEECSSEEVPGAFDAVWGRSASSSHAAHDSLSKASNQSDNGGDLHDLYSANGAANRMRRMVDFLSGTSLHSEDGEADNGGTHGTVAADKGSDDASSDGKAAVEGLLPGARAAAAESSAVRVEGDHGNVPLLRLGDPEVWEVRYSTADDLSSTGEESPFNYKGVISAGSAVQEGKAQRPSEEQNQTVEFEEEQEMREHAYNTAPRRFEEDQEASPGQFPEEPPSTASREQSGEPMLDSTRMSSYTSTRLHSTGNCEQLRTAADEAAAGPRVTTEVQLAAAADDTRLRSVQSMASDDASTEAAAAGRSFASSHHMRNSASRKRQRTSKDDTAGTSAASSHAGELEAEEWAVARESKCVCSSTAQVMFRENKNGQLFEGSGSEKLLRNGLLVAYTPEAPAGAARAATDAKAEVEATAEKERSWTRDTEPIQIVVLKSSDDAITVEADAWHEGSTFLTHDAENEGVVGQHTSRQSSASLGDGDFAVPFHHYSASIVPSRNPGAATTRSIEVVEAISRAISGWAFGPRLHLLILSCMFLAVWALLLVIYLFDGGRGPRQFVGFAVALSFVLALCTGAVQLTGSLFKWKALKCSLDLDLRERILLSLKVLRPEEEVFHQADGTRECGKLLQLLCNSFVDLLTHGSPGLDVGRTMGRRFIAVNTVAGLGAAAFIAGLVCNGQATDASHRLQIQTADAVAVVAAFLYSILLLSLSYYLATPPTPAAVRRSVEMHSAFQYLWTLKLADFLLDRSAVTPRSVQDLHLPSIDTRRSCAFASTLSPRLFKQKNEPDAISFHTTSNSSQSKYLTAKVVLAHPTDIHLDGFEDLRRGQRVLVKMTSAPEHSNASGSTKASSVAYLNLLWCSSRCALEELRIPLSSGTVQPCDEVAVAGNKRGAASTSVLMQHENPQDVMCKLLGMLQDESTDLFMNSRIRRYLSDAGTPLLSASNAYPLVLHIPIRSINSGRRWTCGMRSLNCDIASLISCCTLTNFCKPGRKSIRNADQKATAHVECDEGKDIRESVPSRYKSHGNKTPAVGPWKVHDPPATRPRSVHMHACGTHGQQHCPPTCTETQQAGLPPRAHNNGEARGARSIEPFALLTLFFASEEQRQEFKRCVLAAASS